MIAQIFKLHAYINDENAYESWEIPYESPLCLCPFFKFIGEDSFGIILRISLS